MRSMTGYGRGETDHAGTKFTVELNSVNRKQSDVVINLPRDLVELEPRIRQTINENISRGRTNATVSLHSGTNGARKLALNRELARSYHEAMRTLQKDLNAPGEITIATILQAPGVMRFPEEALNPENTWPAVEGGLRAALDDLKRLEIHLAQFAHHLRSKEPVERTLEFITQEIFRELNTLGAKANDAAISQRVIGCKAELEKIREQVQNLE